MKIVLCCASGISTNMIVGKMKKLASDDVIIHAIGMDNFDLEAQDADIILIAPQMASNKQKIQELFPHKSVEVIPAQMYGIFDGEAVYNLAMTLIKR